MGLGIGPKGMRVGTMGTVTWGEVLTDARSLYEANECFCKL